MTNLTILNLTVLLVISQVLWPLDGFAHPVSYENGTMFMSSYSKDWTEHDLNYTFSPNSALGLSQFRISANESKEDYLISTFNQRFRDNGLDHQANLYLLNGLGARVDQDQSRLAAYTKIQADYETRRVYTLGLAEIIYDDSGQPITRLQYRAGLAPYKSNFDQLATWIIGQVDYRPDLEHEQITFRPVLRFFYETVLVEVGSDFDGNFASTFMFIF